MFNRTTLLFATACVASAVLAFASPRDEGEKEGPLHENMEKIEHGLKKLRRDLKEATKNADSLKIVNEMQSAAQACKLETPPRTAKVPEADRAKFMNDYKKTLIAVQKDMLDLEIALIDGDNAKAQELFKKIHDAEDPGHEKFAQDG